MCVVGESANDCRDRLYATPPSLTADLDLGCTPGVGCMRGVFVPPCVDGTEACTVGGGEPEAVCQDGTRPMIYAEQATAPADPAGSNTWIFYLGGEGGPCDGDGCWFNYTHDDIAFQKAMSTSHPDYATNATQIGSGLVNGATAQNPFASYNRVKFERCTDAASDIIEVVDAYNGVPPSLAARADPGEAIGTRSSPVPVWHKGLSTWTATFNHLANPNGTDLDGDGTRDLPDFAAATTVLVAGSSDAAQWMALAGDELAARVRAVAPGATVRIVIDANFPPGIDNEGRYQAGAAADFNMFADAFVAGDTCVLPPGLDPTADTACSQLNLAPGVGGAKTSHDTLDARNTFRDASCVAAHGVDSPQCSDKVHSMLFHIDTPLLVLADQEDPNVGGGIVPYAESQSYRWSSELPFRTRFVDQVRDLESFWNTTDREGQAGVTGHLMVLAPKARREGQPWGAATHVHLGANDTTNTRMTRCDAAGNRLVTLALSQLIDEWATGNPTELFIYEDGLPADGSPFWVTGGTCRAPE